MNPRFAQCARATMAAVVLSTPEAQSGRSPLGRNRIATALALEVPAALGAPDIGPADLEEAFLNKTSKPRT